MRKNDLMKKTLTGAFCEITDEKDMNIFFGELCSENEITAIAERLEVARRLRAGEMYSEIAADMDISSSLIAKIDEIMKNGKGGFIKGLLAAEKRKKSAEKCYGTFASLYDTLTYDVDYNARTDYVEKLFKKHSDIPVSSVLDLACGTGSVSMILSDKGYEVIGVDSSAEMLAEAAKKQGDRDILFLQQEMKNFELYGTVDAAVCLLDSVNYVIDEDDLLSCFKWVNNYLNPGGVFVFDINTKYKLENVLAGNIFNDEHSDVFYSWENYYDDEENICEFEINFFVKNGNTFNRINEIHYERAYTDGEIKKLLKKAGLELLAVYDDMTELAPHKKSEKVFYVAKRIKM